MFSGNNNQNQNQQKKLPKFQDFIRGIPFVCLFLYISLLIVWALNFFFLIGQNYLSSNDKIYYKFQIWRLFTSLFYQPSLLMISLIILNFQTFMPLIEYKKSSTYMIVNLLFCNFVIQSFVMLAYYTVRMYFPYIPYFSYYSNFDYYFHGGIASLWFYYMTIFCLYNPKQMKLCCFNIKFNRKFYFLIFSFLICLLSWSIRLDIITGIIIGLIQSTLLKKTNSFIQLGAYQFFQKIFKKFGLQKFHSWVRLNSSNFTDKLCTKNVYSNLEYQQIQLLSTSDQFDERTTTSTKNNDPFANKKGIRIGDY